MAGADPNLDEFLTRYGRALSEGDTVGIADAFALPALVLGDEQSIAIADRESIEEAFQGSAERYAEQGLFNAQATVLGAESLTSHLTSVDVEWRATDRDGAVADYRERYRYIVRADGDQRRIQVVIAEPVG